MDFLITLYNAAQSPYLLFIALIVSAIVKINYIPPLLRQIVRDEKYQPTLLFLLIGIISALLCDLSWFMKMVQALFIPMSYAVVVFFIRIGWAAVIVQYLSFSFFLESLTIKKFRFYPLHIALLSITSVISSYFAYLALFQPFTLATEVERDIARATINCLEFFVMRHVVYLVLTFVLVGLYNAYRNIKRHKLPVIIKKQLAIFTIFLVLPYLGLELSLGFIFKSINEMIGVVTLSSLLLAAAIYYCLDRVLKLRFLNLNPRVQEKPNPYMIDNFKNALDQLSSTKTLEELSHITQAFFKETFGVPATAVNLYIKENNPEATLHHKKLTIIEDAVKRCFADQHHPSLLVYDELAFTNFYHETASLSELLAFLEQMHLAIILPIASKKEILGFVTIDQTARTSCYSHAEQDAMSAFGSYLGNVINLLQNKNLNILISQEKKLKDQLYTTHQEINQYKESVHSFLRRSKEKLIGIVFYKNGKFIAANQDVQKMIDVDLNHHEGHPLYQAFHHVANHVQTYQTSYDYYTHDSADKSLLLSGVPHLKKESVIITVTYPEVSDIIMQQMHLLHNPNDWDYLLYLASTKAGSLINHLIPASSEQLLNIKIALLKAALHKKALLIDAPQQDLETLVDIIHRISGRETMQTIELHQPTQGTDIAMMLFGDGNHKKALLERLDNGTLFIKNSHFLDATTQEHLVEYIRYGMYRAINGDQKFATNCRIICSTNQNIVELMHKGVLNPDLFRLFKKATIAIPSLLTLASKEVSDLIDGYSDAIISSYALKKILALSAKEKQKLIDYPPVSLRELKNKIEQIVLHKSDNQIEEAHEQEHGNDDPDLTIAGRLGKHALKDPIIMQKLWQKFKNQNKIALFLGVNRSSVNRRFKIFDIGKGDEGIA